MTTRVHPSQTLLEYSAVIAWMLAVMSIVHTLLSPRMTEGDMRNLNHDVNLPVAAFNMLANLLLVLLVLPRYRRVFGLFLNARPVVAFSILAAVSTLWSINPQYTLRRTFTFAIGALAATYFGERYSVNEIGKIISFAVIGLIVLSVICFVISPSSVMDVSHPGDWMGVSEHKNVFGSFTAFGMCCIALTDFGKWNGLRAPALALCSLMLYLSHSASAWLTFAVIFVAIPVLLKIQRTQSVAIPIAGLMSTVALVSYCMTSSVMTNLLVLLGKDPTLTGRTELWQNLLGEIARRPWLGYGYEAFFSNSSELLALQSHATWLPPSAHNGYLQVAVNDGLIGIAIALWLIGSYMLSALRYSRRTRSRAELLPLTLGIFWLLHNCVEVTLFEGQTLIAFTIIALLASMRAHEAIGIQSWAASRPGLPDVNFALYNRA